ELARVYKLLRKIQPPTCPFQPRPKTNERPHWKEPSLVAEIEFTEWTTEGRLRHPTYLGIREDVKPEAVRREPTPLLDHVSAVRECGHARSHAGELSRQKPEQPAAKRVTDGLLHQLTQIEEEGGTGMLLLPGGHR